MFKNTFQSGFLSILYSIGARRAPTHHVPLPPCKPRASPLCCRRHCAGAHTPALSAVACCLPSCATSDARLCRRPIHRTGSKPLQIWKEEVNNGHCKRITDNDIQSSVLEIMSTNISTTYVTCPAASDRTLGIKLPFLVMIIKNVRRAPRCAARACRPCTQEAAALSLTHRLLRPHGGRTHARVAAARSPPAVALSSLARTFLDGSRAIVLPPPPPPEQLKKYFTFEVQVLDDKNVRRRFRASNYQSTTRVKPFICTMPMRLDEGWNQIQFNLSDFTRRAYGTNYIETLRVQIHANCRIRRIYFSDRLYSEEELPPEFKLFLPIQKQQAA